MQPQITLTLSLDETNTVLEALGQLPYVRVYELIESVGRQARAQVETTPPADAQPRLAMATPA